MYRNLKYQRRNAKTLYMIECKIKYESCSSLIDVVFIPWCSSVVKLQYTGLILNVKLFQDLIKAALVTMLHEGLQWRSKFLLD